MHKFLTAPAFFLLLAGCAGESAQDLSTTFEQGVAAYDAGDYAKAYAIWRGIDDVDLAAMRNVAMMLRRGQGVPRDPKAAEDLYQTAAAAGLPTAQADLADMLLRGEAGPPNPKAALPLLEAAAAANHPLAQYELAEMYETGANGLVPQNMTVARRLYTEAAGHGMKEAQERLDQLARNDSPAPPPLRPGEANPAPGPDLRPGRP